jgi:hypothetical protein
MAAVTPPEITPPPTPAPQRGDRNTFRDRVDAFITWMTAAVMQFLALAANVYANAVDAHGSADAASGSAVAAASAAATALGSSEAASAFADDAMDHRDAAQGFAAAADAAAAALSGTSTTSLVVGIGVRTFTGAGLAGKKFTPQQTLKAVSPLDANKYMVGTVSPTRATARSRRSRWWCRT